MTWLIAAAGGAMLAMVPGSMDQYQTPKLLAMGLAALGLLLRPSDRACYLDLPAALLAMCWVACSLFSLDRPASLTGSYLAPFDGLTAAAVYLGLMVGVARLGATVDEVLAAVCWASLPLSGYAIAQRLVFDPLLPMPLPGGDRVIAAAGSPVYLGAVLAVVAACAMAVRHRQLGRTALLLAGVALWLTGTRGAVLAAGAAVWVLLPGRQRWAALALLPLLALHPRALSLAADAGRWEVWKAAWRMFLDHPATGVGPGAFEVAFRQYVTPAFVQAHRSDFVTQQSAHNVVLQVLATGGLLGAAGAVGLAAAAWRQVRADAPALAVLAAVLAAGLFNPLPHTALAVAAMVLGAASSRESGFAPARSLTLAGAVAVALFVVGRVAVGDWHYGAAWRAARAGDRPGVAAALQRAALANPWDMQVVARRVDGVLSLTGGMGMADRRLAVAACAAWSRAALARHPNDSLAHELHGRNLLAAAQLGLAVDPREALYRFRDAQRLAPTFSPVITRRRATALLLGETAEAAAAEQDLARVRGWAAGGA